MFRKKTSTAQNDQTEATEPKTLEIRELTVEEMETAQGGLKDPKEYASWWCGASTNACGAGVDR